MTEPDDRELEQYLAGDGKLSRSYREASRESAPPELDEAILAQARAELKRKPPSLNRVLAPVALAASVVLGVNLAWNLHQAEPVPADLDEPEAQMPSRDEAFVPSPPPPAAAPVPQPERKAKLAPPPATAARADEESDAMVMREEVAQQREREALRKQQVEERGLVARGGADEPELRSFAAEPPGEGQKVDRLIAYVGGLQGAVFIRNGKEYGPAEAAKHLQLKREKAGDRVKTADDFIRVCASHSSVSGDAYLIRFSDGRTRTAEDVLREELARINGVGVD